MRAERAYNTPTGHVRSPMQQHWFRIERITGGHIKTFKGMWYMHLENTQATDVRHNLLNEPSELNSIPIIFSH